MKQLTGSTLHYVFEDNTYHNAVQRYHFVKISKNSEANASELLENLEEMLVVMDK